MSPQVIIEHSEFRFISLNQFGSLLLTDAH